MDLDKIFMHKEFLQKALTFEEISKLYREVLYNEYENMNDSDMIHCYQLLRNRKYLEDKIKW